MIRAFGNACLRTLYPLQTSQLAHSQFCLRASLQLFRFSTTTKDSKDAVLINKQITFASMRVVYNDPISNAKTWKIMPRADALKLADDLSSDLILVDGKADPPVCRIDLYEPEKEMQQERTKLRKKKDNKPKPVKEILVGCLIEKHDLEVKARKIKEFLETGHQVKLTIFGKKHQLLKHPLAMDATTLKVFEAVESFVENVRPPTNSAPNRVEFVFMPKKGASSK